MSEEFLAAICLVSGMVLGSIYSQSTIQGDCEKVGAFRVFEKVYICEVKK